MRQRSMVRFLALLPSLLAVASTQSITDEIDPQAVKTWALAFGDNLMQLARHVTAYDNFVRTFNSSSGVTLERADNDKMITSITNKLSDMFADKRKALQDLVEKAEEARANYSDLSAVDPEDKKLQYWNAKFLTTDPPEGNISNMTNLTAGAGGKQQKGVEVTGQLRGSKGPVRKGDHDDEGGKSERPKVPYLATLQSCHFDYMLVNTSLSTVHIPTNIYDGDAEIVSEADWSEKLDEVFRNNWMRDPSMKWQYFASQSGMFRVFPGIKWPKRWNEDFYDCRTQNWYIRTAASPKDVVILVDNSGSMTGLRWQIAKKTIEGILNSLTSDDFFAVVPFQGTPAVISNCGNDSLLQATAENKQFIKKELKSDKYQPKDIAVYPAALEFAFKLLRFNETETDQATDRTSNCNKAIMVISDGAPPGTDEVFAAYNKDQKIRVFSYLIGREISDAKEVRDMACNNRGYYVHVSTLADVAEYVQEYIHVMSRPMVIFRDRQTIYTNVYIDPIRFPRGSMSYDDYMENRLLITVAQPVYDLRVDTANQGVFQGVMGTDIPLHDILKHAPGWKLGPNAYIMMVTNNGHVVTHPMFRPKMLQDPVGMMRLPDYTDLHTDIAEIELVVTPHRNSSDFAANYSLELRTSLIKTESREFNQTVVGTYDSSNKRVFVRAHRYRVVNIRDAPYGLGLAMPQQYGYYSLDARVPLLRFNAEMIEMVGNKSAEQVEQILVPYELCYVKGGEVNLSDTIGFILERLNNRFTEADLVCDMDYLENLFFDANATKSAVEHWQNLQMNDSLDFVFIATRTGLIRYKLLHSANITESFWSQVMQSNKTVEATYYRRTVDNAAGHLNAKETDGSCENCFSGLRLTVTVDTKSIVMDDEESGAEVETNSTQSPQGSETRVHKQRAAGATEKRKVVSIRNAALFNDSNATSAIPLKARVDNRSRALLTLTVPVERFNGVQLSSPIAVAGAQLPVETMQSLANSTRIGPCTVSGNWTSSQPFQRRCRQQDQTESQSQNRVLMRNNPQRPTGGKAQGGVRQPAGGGRRTTSARTTTTTTVRSPQLEERGEVLFSADNPYASVTMKSICDGYNHTCFVLDENGFVVFTHHVRTEIYTGESYVGRFFGEIKGHYWIVSELTDKVYRRIEFIDYQAVCQKGADQKSAASSILWTPFSWFGALLQKLMWNFLVMLIETDLDWIYHVAADAADGFIRQVRDESGIASAAEHPSSAEAEESMQADSEGMAEEPGEDHSGETSAASFKISKIKEPCIEHMSLYYYTDAWKKNDTKLLTGTYVA